ncbi:hypothetical protein JTB14_005344 [Gonioctena quinquepunctata]|nr:hypothetical protein JTB14_005344 [Gonioctena quinquepunctata]
MTEETFDKLLHRVQIQIQKNNTVLRDSISPKTKLIITLRYLATGESSISLQYNFRVSQAAISGFIPLVCQAIYDELKGEYLHVPNTSAEWLEVARNFEETWNMPNCLGALDGKHILIKAQQEEGSSFYNYKGQNSIVLLALVDANYKFLYFNVGINGRISDGGVYRECELSKAIAKNYLKFPEDRSLPMRTKKIPFVIAADAAFPLTTHIMKPYPFRKLTNEQRIFNYRLSRARRVVENAFGILANRFRCLLNVSALRPEKVKIITKACCALHNFLSHEMKTHYTGKDPAEEIDRRYTFVYGLSVQAGNRPKTEAIQTREEFKEYFNGVGSVPWQEDMLYRL